MRTCVILNPAAGGGVSPERIRQAASCLPGVEVRVSPLPGAVGSMAAAAVEDGFVRIVAAGGDGTVSEVASALLDSGAAVECGVLPVGTGNDFALSLGIPASLDQAAALLLTGEACPVDAIRLSAHAAGSEDASARGRPVGHTSGSHAWNAAVGGFGGLISERLSPGMKRRWRALAYLRAAAAELQELRPRRVRFVIDGQVSEFEILMLVIANGSHAGGGIPFAPDARLDDGWLDVVAIRAVPLHQLVGLVRRVLAGRHTTDCRVVHRQALSVTVEAEAGFWFNVDGETWTDGSATFDLLPSALPFVGP